MWLRQDGDCSLLKGGGGEGQQARIEAAAAAAAAAARSSWGKAGGEKRREKDERETRTRIGLCGLHTQRATTREKICRKTAETWFKQFKCFQAG